MFNYKKVIFSSLVVCSMLSAVNANAAYPEKPLTLIVPFAAGGPTDILARLIADTMSSELKQTIIVENAPGAGGTIGTKKAAEAKPDGYTLLIGNVGTLAANKGLYDALPFDVLKDFTPLASIGDAPQVITARKDFPASNFDEFADYVKNHKGTINAGAAGIGSGSFLGALLVNSSLEEDISIINYRGAGQALADVMGGQLDYLVDSATTSIGAINSGRAKGISVLRSNRISALPNVSATSESQYPDLRYDIWNMVLTPKGVPQDITEKLNITIQAALKNEALITKYESSGIQIPASEQQTLEGAQKLLTTEIERWLPLVSKLGIKLN